MGFACTGLAHEFRTPRGALRALENVTFDVAEGEFVSIVGPSGCGKTTLLKLVAGLLRCDEGTVRFDNGHGSRPPATLVFQEHGVYEWMNVLDNVAFGLEALGVQRRERRQRASVFVDRVGLAEFASAYPYELSVGMRQRVAIARAFVTGSPNLLMDEPFGALDAQTKLVLQRDLLEIWEAERKSVLYVTHDIAEAITLGDRVLVMTGRPGKIREDIRVPLDRPRSVGPERAQEASELEWHIWKLLEQEVLAALRQGV